MARKTTTIDDEPKAVEIPAPVPVPISAPVIPADAGTAIYTDRAQPPHPSGLMEGIVNFETVTAAARAIAASAGKEE